MITAHGYFIYFYLIGFMQLTSPQGLHGDAPLAPPKELDFTVLWFDAGMINRRRQ